MDIELLIEYLMSCIRVHQSHRINTEYRNHTEITQNIESIQSSFIDIELLIMLCIRYTNHVE